MSIIITNNEELIKDIPCLPIELYFPKGDGILSESIYVQDINCFCARAIEQAIEIKSTTVAFSIQGASNPDFSLSLNTLLSVLSEENVSRQGDNLEMIVYMQTQSKTDNFTELLDSYIAKSNIITPKLMSFGDYGDRLKPEFEYYTDRLATQKRFAEYLSELIDKKGFSSYADVYRAAGISKFTFSKIMNLKKPHQPSKGTVAALSIGLKLDLEEAQKLYNSAGYYLGYSDLTDKIIRFFIENEIYDINEVNYCLLHYNLPILGEQARECKVRFKR